MADLLCRGCGGPVHATNKTGYCQVKPNCRREQRRLKSAARYREGYAKEWRKANPDSQMLASARIRARKAGVPCAITRKDIQDVWADACPVFGYQLVKHQTGTHAHSRASFSLDRIDPARGYVPGNIQILSQRANAMKSDATPAELLQFAAWINETYGKSA